MIDDKRMQKIEALLAQAEGTPYPEEAAAFARKAQELMTRWQIDEAVLAAARQDREAQVDDIDALQFYVVSNIYLEGRLSLLNIVCAWNHCRATALSRCDYRCRACGLTWRPPHARRRPIDGCCSCVESTKSERVKRITIVGTSRDREYARRLWLSLQVQAATEMAGEEAQAALAKDEAEEFDLPWWRPPTAQDRAGFRKRWRISFLRGYRQTIARRLREAADAVASAHEAGDECVALALSTLDDAVARQQAEILGTIGNRAPSKATGAGELSAPAGRAAGERAAIPVNGAELDGRKALAAGQKGGVTRCLDARSVPPQDAVGRPALPACARATTVRFAITVG